MIRELLVQLPVRLRVFVTTLGAIATALVNAATRRGEPHRVELTAGDMAPDFALPASDGRTYRLSDFRGRQKVVLAWFPKAFTGGCTAECGSIGANSQSLRRLNVAYFGASVDSAETNRQFAAALSVDFPILSDGDKSVARLYGVLGRSGFPSRWTFYIDTDGRILAIDKHVRTATHGLDIEHTLLNW
jgi:peroxiredoxin Q/BCP